jgi:O-antigen/teichoic acid export membrane protein
MAQATLPRVIARNAIFMTLTSVMLKGVNFFYQVYVVRSLGDDRFGQFSTAVAWVGLFSIVAELGVTQFAMREIARDRSRVRTLFWNVAMLRLAIALIGIGSITLGAYWVGYSTVIVQAVMVYTLTFVISALASPLDAVLTAHERLDQVSITGVASQLSSALLGTFVLAADLGVVAFTATGLLAMLPGVALAMRYARGNGIDLRPMRIDLRGWPALIRGGLPFAIISLMLIISFSIDTVMLSWHVSDAEVGWYNVAYGFAGSLLFFFTGLSDAMVPSLAKTYVEAPDAVADWYRRMLRMIIIFGLPMALGGMLLAGPLMAFLYGPEYTQAALVFRLIVWDAPLLMYTSFCGNMTTVTGAERAAARIYGINALANIVLNAFAIPAYGIMGAAVVTVLTDLVGVLQFMRLFSRTLAAPDLSGLALRTLPPLIALIAVVFGAALFGLHVLALIALGAAAYLLCAAALGVFDAQERGVLSGVLNRVRAAVRLGGAA